MEKRKQMQTSQSQQLLANKLSFKISHSQIKSKDCLKEPVQVKLQLNTPIKVNAIDPENLAGVKLSNPQQPNSQLDRAVEIPAELPMTGRQAFVHLQSVLTDYEKVEV